MSHYFNNGIRTAAGDAAYMNPPGSGEPRNLRRTLWNAGPIGPGASPAADGTSRPQPSGKGDDGAPGAPQAERAAFLVRARRYVVEDHCVEVTVEVGTTDEATAARARLAAKKSHLDPSFSIVTVQPGGVFLPYEVVATDGTVLWAKDADHAQR